jgi:phosphonate metabolism-associated iron-containing alcohol dehydrogenase
VSEWRDWRYHNPVRIVAAPLDSLAAHVKADHVLLVTTPGSVRRGLAQQVIQVLYPRRVTVWDSVKPNPDLQHLDAASVQLRGRGIDSVIGLGGGSVLDTAKVLAVTLAGPISPNLAKIFRDNCTMRWRGRLPLVLVPTTSGTGSEVTPFATVWDHAQQKKYSLSGDFIYPDVAILDAHLTLTLSNEGTLYPALDAISHALESIWNKNCTLVSKALAFQSLTLSCAFLPKAVIAPENLEARQMLQTASALAGLAISQTRTAIAHSMSYPLTSHFGVPHGLACSFTLPYFLRVNSESLSTQPSETLVLKATLELLESLELKKLISCYANSAQILSLAGEMFNPSRADNYCFVQSLDIRAAIFESV